MLIHLENGCCFGFVIFFINFLFFGNVSYLQFFIMDYGNVFGKVGYWCYLFWIVVMYFGNASF
jgi:hypothetical protein